MMAGSVRVDTDRSVCGIDALIVDNCVLRAIFLPELGGKLWQLTHVPSGRDLLWQHPRLRPRPVLFGANYDDVFYGGWDVLFPNDETEGLRGEMMPDHGEVWSLPWRYAIEDGASDEVTVHLWVETPISACRLDTWVRVAAGEPCVRFRHRLTNLGTDPLPYLWKLHVAVALEEGSRLDLGARRMLIGDWGTPRNGLTGVAYDWPHLTDTNGDVHDMRSTPPPTSGVTELQYATELAGGWCAVTHSRELLGLGILFDPTVFRSCWTFASYGGWQNLHVAVLEPCTGYPLSVREGVRRGTHQVLGGSETVDCEVTAVIVDGLAAVDGAHLDRLAHRNIA